MKKTYEYFHIEAKPSCKIEKVKEFFESKEIKVETIEQENKTDKNIFYKCTYNYSPDTLITLELVKKEKLSEKLDFKITNISVNSDFMEIAEKKIEEIKSEVKITYPLKYEENVNKFYIKQVGAPGLEFINEELIKKQRGVLGYMLKTLGRNILEGKLMMNISLPININDYRSITENFAYQTRIHEYFLEQAADVNNVERMKILMTHFVAAFHFQLALGKPFNPILGETFQTKSGNSLYYAEQTSHHPPVTHFYILNPKFKFYGYLAPEAHGTPNSMTGHMNGSYTLEYNDGAKYKFSYPNFTMMGMMIGKRYMNFSGTARVDDLVNDLTAFVNINPDNRSFFGKLFSKDTYPDYLVGCIANKSDIQQDKNGSLSVQEDHALAKFEGEWSKFLNVDDECYWIIEEEKLKDLTRYGYILPSDAHYRYDLLLYKMGLENQASEAKVFLEERQRKDEALRKEYRTK